MKEEEKAPFLTLKEIEEDMMKKERLSIENPIFWVLLMGVGYQALLNQHWPSMLTLLFFIGLVIPSQMIAMDKRDNPE